MKEAILKLRNEVKQCTTAGRAIGEKIRQAKGLDRYQLWNAKRSLGDGARYVFLAYGCLRCMPYARIEQKTRKDNGPSPTYITSAIWEALDEAQKPAWPRERVQAWLKGEAWPVAAETVSTEVAA